MPYQPYRRYFRPLVQSGPVRSPGAKSLAGGALWFSHAEILARDEPRRIVPVDAIPSRMLTCLTAPRAPFAGLMMDTPRLMGILNVTPDSFSDGGDHPGPARAVAHGRDLVAAGADILDVGGESTRPGAAETPVEVEIARIEPTIRVLSADVDAPISIDTRKQAVAETAIGAGASILNDVSGLTFDPALSGFVADHHVPVCITHSSGPPEVMQTRTAYDNLLLDIYDFFGRQIDRLERQGTQRARIMIDPGLGFGKTRGQNLDILRNLSLFHGHGVPILIGGSRKGFIRDIGQAEHPKARLPGSLAVALAASAQGAQVLRVHDVAETRQALRLWRAIEQGERDGT